MAFFHRFGINWFRVTLIVGTFFFFGGVLFSRALGGIGLALIALSFLMFAIGIIEAGIQDWKNGRFLFWEVKSKNRKSSDRRGVDDR